jgi:phage baseplate assembly protein W
MQKALVSIKIMVFCGINKGMATFIGFSTIGKRTGSQVLEDKELAKRDLLNHFYTRRGERLGEPEFGSILPLLVFEQFDQLVIDAADEDVRAIIDNDPRWELIDYQIDANEHDLVITVELRYVPDTTAEQLVLKYTDTQEI